MSAATETSAALSDWECHAGDVVFGVSAPETWAKVQRARLAEFLISPPGELDLGRFTLTVHVDDLAFRRVMREVVQHTTVGHVEPIPGLVLLEAHQSSGRRCYVVAVDSLEHQAGAYAVAASGPSIELFLHSASARGHRYPLRLIREAMLRTYEDAGGTIFHAAGVDVGGTGVMICGPRAAGKTTTLAFLLRSMDTALLSNDRLIVLGNRMVAVPLPVPTALGTARHSPSYGRRQRATVYGPPGWAQNSAPRPSTRSAPEGSPPPSGPGLRLPPRSGWCSCPGSSTTPTRRPRADSPRPRHVTCSPQAASPLVMSSGSAHGCAASAVRRAAPAASQRGS
ncbi:hypothetical protein [Gandjariella thermophila]|uniref:Uncharacterized protein n=1 Tax=Gandjariella thermophila TaxID=1931992 RepID=A0A4D4IZS1_9PSEU|nr:hypothetical protein [Gandjariella thermophila]GDY29751.1 hypothetical protein GTS_13840 [Gandjariella thermophila]